MFSVSEASGAVLGRCAPLPPRRSSLDAALGCVLAEGVAADLDAPPFDKALVDGYAVRAADVTGGGRRLRVGEEIPAGRTPSGPIAPGEAVPIMTGAPLPPGADAVVMVERTHREGVGTVVIDDPDVVPGLNRLARGREMHAGDVVLQAGTVLTATRLGLLAAVGRAGAVVIPPPRVAVLATGDELVEPGEVPGPGQIRNSNSVTLRALVASCGALAEPLPTAADEPAALRRALALGLGADVLLVTGGVSAGTRDLVPPTLESLGVERVFHKIRLKPGKPLWFGVGGSRPGGSAGCLVFGLPGNPVSGVVGFLLFVRPALETLAGRPGPPDRTRPARLATPFTHKGDRPTYHPSRFVSAGGPGDLPEVEPVEWAGSADLRAVAQADGFAAFGAGDRRYERGEIVPFLALG